MLTHSFAAGHLASLPRPRILIVDDQPTNIEALYQIFHEDYDVFMATGGYQAMEFCQQTPPDLILLDVIMPEFSGLDLSRRLKQNEDTAGIPIIFVTAQDNAADEVKALEAGGVDFISKPVNPPVVRARVSTHLALKARSDLLRKMALVDGLTGLPNRRYFDQALQDAWRHCRRRAMPLALMMVDIDYFKRYNDHYGHQRGDVCLQRVASELRQTFGRPYDVVARYGGEEFVCVLPDTPLVGAQRKAKEFLSRVRGLGLPHANSPASPVVTVSIGVAAHVPDAVASISDLVARADRALYAAKNQGRNGVLACTFSGIPMPEQQFALLTETKVAPCSTENSDSNLECIDCQWEAADPSSAFRQH